MNLNTLARILFAPLKRRRWLLSAVIALGLWSTAPTANAIVGYVNVDLTNGYTYVASPLDSPPNALTNIVPSLPIGSRAYFWDVTNQVFLPRATFDVTGWDLNYSMPVGIGVVLYVPVRYTNTFVGNVLEGALTNVVAGSNRFSLLGCKVPVGGPLSINTNGVGFPRIDGATVHLFRSLSQSFTDGFACFTNYGWFDPKGIESTNGPILNVAESFFVQNPGPTTNWLRIFTNGNIFGPQTLAASGGTTLEIQKLSVQAGNATLTINNPSAIAFDVQFSSDGATWSTVAANQTGSNWTGPLPDPLRGRFNVIASQTEGGAK